MRMIVVSAAVLAVLAGTPSPAQQAVIAPALPMPDVGEDGPATAYLRAAEAALATGRTGEAQQALEMAQTRLLDRSVPLGQTGVPSADPAVAQISAALQALAAGDRMGCVTQIQAALDTIRARRQ
jgi:hypothetical protein